jgi:hypothetical protein
MASGMFPPVVQAVTTHSAAPPRAALGSEPVTPTHRLTFAGS